MFTFNVTIRPIFRSYNDTKSNMAYSVYISSNLTQQQLEFMKLLDEYEIELFQFDEIEKSNQ
jgi:hypothetical protein